VCLSVCVSVCPAIRFHIFSKFAGNILWVMTRIVGYLLFSARNARACMLNARACVHSLILERILFKFAGNILRLTISVKDYVIFMFTHRVQACARACVIKHSLIYGPILFKSAAKIQIPTSSICYLLFMFTHCAHTRVVKTFTYLWTNSLKIDWEHTTNDHKLHGLHTYHFHARGYAQARD
jgi:hypothetical protein